MALRSFDAVAVRGRDGDDEERRFGVAVVEGPMGNLWRDFQAVIAAEHVRLTIDLNGERAGEDEKELPGAGVVMGDFRRAWRHAFLDDAEFVAAG